MSGGQLHQAWHSTNRGTSPLRAGRLPYVFDLQDVFDLQGGLRVYQPETGALITKLDCGADTGTARSSRTA